MSRNVEEPRGVGKGVCEHVRLCVLSMILVVFACPHIRVSFSSEQVSAQCWTVLSVMRASSVQLHRASASVLCVTTSS